MVRRVVVEHVPVDHLERFAAFELMLSPDRFGYFSDLASHPLVSQRLRNVFVAGEKPERTAGDRSDAPVHRGLLSHLAVHGMRVRSIGLIPRVERLVGELHRLVLSRSCRAGYRLGSVTSCEK